MKQIEADLAAGGPAISFHQQSAGLSLAIVGGATFYYLARMWPMRSSALTDGALPKGYALLVLATVVLIVAAQIVLQAVLASGVGLRTGATPAARARGGRRCWPRATATPCWRRG